ncbi:MAG: hypothetical protein ACYSTZ_13380, partial [Planctomycetota bacterium]
MPVYLPPAGGLSFACWQTGGYFNNIANKSQQKKTAKKPFFPVSQVQSPIHQSRATGDEIAPP